MCALRDEWCFAGIVSVFLVHLQRQLPLPQYEFGSDGPQHTPKFKAFVRIVVGPKPDDVYSLPASSTYSKKTDAKAAAAFAALLELSRRGWLPDPSVGYVPAAAPGYTPQPVGYAAQPSSPYYSTPHGAGYHSAPAGGALPPPVTYIAPGTHFQPQPGAAYMSAPPRLGGVAVVPPAAQSTAASGRPQPPLEALQRVVLIDATDPRAAVPAGYAPHPGDFVVAFATASGSEPEASSPDASLPAIVVRATGVLPGAVDVMLIAWVYKFLERYGAQVRDAMVARGGPVSLPITIVSPAGAALGPSGVLSLAAATLQADVEYGQLGIRVSVVPDTSHIPLTV